MNAKFNKLESAYDDRLLDEYLSEEDMDEDYQEDYQEYLAECRQDEIDAFDHFGY